MNHSLYDVGDHVVTTKALRNDGTYPDPQIAVGEILVPPGTRGEVLNVGLYLQEHIVYAVAFRNGRVVGCLEREVAPADAAVGEGVSAAKVLAAGALVTGVSTVNVPAGDAQAGPDRAKGTAS